MPAQLRATGAADERAAPLGEERPMVPARPRLPPRTPPCAACAAHAFLAHPGQEKLLTVCGVRVYANGQPQAPGTSFSAGKRRCGAPRRQ